MLNQYLPKLRYMGPASVVGGWLVILAAISRNPWFVYTENAFSDLGNPMANDPWLFNYGMILNGVLIVLYSIYLIEVSFNKTGTVGGAFMMITGVFLMLIGVFHEGTMHHYFVSVWFFTQSDLTILTWGLALYRDRRWSSNGRLFLALSLFGPVVAYVVPWPSTATVETFGILIMNIWVLSMNGITSQFIDSRR
jgi:hypothetical membrane protein